MNTRFSTSRKLAAAWIASMLASATAMAARGDGAYLPITSPTPLRFAVPMARTFALPPVKSNDAKPVIDPAQSPTNAVPEPLTGSGTEPNLGAAPVFPQPFPLGESMSPVPAAGNSQAGDVPPITPQILAEYFKPVPGSTNAPGVSVFLPVQIGFIPPMEKPPASSRATYKVQ